MIIGKIRQIPHQHNWHAGLFHLKQTVSIIPLHPTITRMMQTSLCIRLAMFFLHKLFLRNFERLCPWKWIITTSKKTNCLIVGTTSCWRASLNTIQCLGHACHVLSNAWPKHHAEYPTAHVYVQLSMSLSMFMCISRCYWSETQSTSLTLCQRQM